MHFEIAVIAGTDAATAVGIAGIAAGISGIAAGIAGIAVETSGAAPPACRLHSVKQKAVTQCINN